MKVTASLLIGSSLLATACSGFQDDSNLDSSESGVAIPYVEGNPTCQQLGYAYEAKAEKDYDLPLDLGYGYSITIDLSDDQKTLSWDSNIGIDAVIMKAGDGAYVYTYNPEATSGDGLVTPNNNGGQQATLSHVSFCYDFELQVEKTASTSFTRNHDWTIQKSAAETSVVLSLNQYYLLGFTVTVSPAGYTDGNWAVGGTITVTNPDPENSANVASITDEMSDFGAIAVDCGEGVTFPLTLAPGASIECEYATPVPSGDARTNTATATAAGDSLVGTGSASVPVEFSTEASTVSTVDGCVDVTDTHQGSLGQVCASDGSTSFEYTVPLEFAVCGPSQLTNTASFASQTSDETGSSTVIVDIDVPCVGGCTLTQGYWKTHSEYGPAPHDEDGWAGHENDIFFLSNQTLYEVLWTAPQGNAYYILAHQYIAAERNIANGAAVTAEVQAALDAAKALFETWTPAAVKALKGNNAVKQQFVSLAFTLDQYNNGITGPGHCSE